jgi:hypothetical protein
MNRCSGRLLDVIVRRTTKSDRCYDRGGLAQAQDDIFVGELVKPYRLTPSIPL